MAGLYTVNGRSRTMAQWAFELGISTFAIRDRLQRGWTIERAMTERRAPYGNHVGKAITFEGRTQSMAAWAREVGLKATTLSYRLRSGMSLRAALRAPLQAKSQASARKAKLYTHDGLTMTVKGWAKLRGVTVGTIYQRLHRGYPLDAALGPRLAKASARNCHKPGGGSQLSKSLGDRRVVLPARDAQIGVFGQ